MKVLALDLKPSCKVPTSRILFEADVLREPVRDQGSDLFPDVSATGVIFSFQDDDLLQSALR
jgi:hypothetical protein